MGCDDAHINHFLWLRVNGYGKSVVRMGDMRMSIADWLIGIAVRVNEMVVRENDIAVLVKRMGESVVGIWVLVNEVVGLVVEMWKVLMGVVITRRERYILPIVEANYKGQVTLLFFECP